MQCAAVMLGQRYYFYTSDFWSESGADQLFYPGLTKALNYILWDDCEKILQHKLRIHTSRSPRRPRERAVTKNVHVHVRDGLPSMRSVINHHTKTFGQLKLSSNLPDREE